jgi:cell division septation protein DedD
MSIDPNKAFGMKATNRLYTIEFRRDTVNGTTEVTAVDNETRTLSFVQRLKAAWAVLTGKSSFGELVFPLRLRNTDLYHMSYIYRPEKVAKSETSVTSETPTAKAPKAAKPKVEKTVTTEAKPKAPRKPKAPKAPKTDTPA